MAKLSLKDKVGEMTQYSVDVLSVGEPYNLKKPHALDPAKLTHVLKDLRVGSILNCGGHGYTKEHWHKIMNTIQKIATTEKESGIPILYGIDAIHGANYTREATLFPQQIGLAATFNPNLIEQLAELTAYETRASGIPWNFSPVLDIGRDARWPRLWETFGEDVHLASTMARAMVRGYQGNNNEIDSKYRVAACMKHFLGYSVTLTGKDRTQAWIPERQMREYFLPTFEAAIQEGAATVMINSGEMNGIPVHMNYDVLTTLLRDELGFTGIALTDWEDIKYLVSRHRVAATHKEAIKMAINAGIDMSMVPLDLEFPKLLEELVNEGEIPMARIDQAVRRILKLKYDLGLFEKPIYPLSDFPKFGSKEFEDLAYQAALESITLLKNKDQILPLKKGTKVLVTGPTANSLNALNGGWTHTWQGRETEYNTKGKLSIAEALEGSTDLLTTYMASGDFEKNENVDAILASANQQDVIILCLGENTYTEKPGDLRDLNLPQSQYDLANALAKTGKPLVLVMVQGRPRIIHQIEPVSKGILMAYLPGNEGAPALVELITGKSAPSGKLPFTYPRYANDLIPYDHKGTDVIGTDFGPSGFNPQFEFGFGLTYGAVSYSDFEILNDKWDGKPPLSITVEVKNNGNYAINETVLLFATDEVALITPSVKRLRAYKKIELNPGQSKKVEFSIDMRDLMYVGQDMKHQIEDGLFTFQCGTKKAKIELKQLSSK